MKIENVDGIIKLTAEDGKIIADKNGILGREIWLGDDRKASEYTETDDPEIVQP